MTLHSRLWHLSCITFVAHCGIVLCCVVFCVASHRIVLHCTAFARVALCCIALRYGVFNVMPMPYFALCCIVLCRILRYADAVFCIVLHCAMPYFALCRCRVCVVFHFSLCLIIVQFFYITFNICSCLLFLLHGILTHWFSCHFAWHC